MESKAKFMAVSTRLVIDDYNWIKEDADKEDISMSEWLMRAIYSWMDNESSEISWEDLQEKESWDELVEFGEEFESKVNPEDHKTWLSKDVDGLRYALAYDLDIFTPDDIYDMSISEVEDLESSLGFDLDPDDYESDDDYREAVIDEFGSEMTESDE